MPIPTRPEIESTPPAHHGAFDYVELEQLGLSPDEVLDFSVNSNPYGSPPNVRDAINAVPLDRYPDRDCIALRQKLADYHQVTMDELVVGNGTAELLMLIAQAFVQPGTRVLIRSHTFSEYERASRLMGATIERVSMDGESISAILQAVQPDVMFICNPNNPTGDRMPLPLLRDLVAAHSHCLFIVDEAYAQFTQATTDDPVQRSRVSNYDNLLMVRSLTKDFALAGLRLGYAIGTPRLISSVARMRPAWNVNSLAQAAGIAALDSLEWLQDCVAKLHQHKRELVAGLRKLGLNPEPSTTHYFIVDVGDATAFRLKLLAHKLMVRDCTSFGLPRHVRISARTPAENTRLLNAIEKVL